MTKKTRTPKNLAEYREMVEATVAEELKNMDAHSVRDMVRSRLEKDAFGLVTAALGISQRWNEWEVDHCNGLRNAAAVAMLENAKSAAREWLQEQAGSLPDLPKAAIKALHRDYLERLEYEIADMLRERAHEDARVYVERMLDGAAA